MNLTNDGICKGFTLFNMTARKSNAWPVGICAVLHQDVYKRQVKLTLLFFLSSCGLAGIVVLLGQNLGSMARLARGVVIADLPWGCLLYTSRCV